MTTPRIVSTFADLMRSASSRWRLQVLERMVADALEIDKMTINRWAHGVTRYDLVTVGQICAYFGCEVGELLVLSGPDTNIPEIAHRAVRRRTIPKEGVPGLTCHSLIGTRLKDVPPGTHIDIHRSRLADLRKDRLTRIDRPTLEELCAVLGVASVNELLYVDLTKLDNVIDLDQ